MKKGGFLFGSPKTSLLFNDILNIYMKKQSLLDQLRTQLV